jgi:hypothetical protein
MALEEALALKRAQGGRHRLARRADQPGEELMSQGQLDLDAVWPDLAVRARQLDQRLAESVAMRGPGRVTERLLTLAQRVEQAIEKGV